MEISKLKIESFRNFSINNFPEKYRLELASTEKDVEVILYYIDEVADVQKFVELCERADLKPDNRVIMVYEKGRKDGVNRDSIFMPFKNGDITGFKMKAPMLCSLSDKLSAFVQQKVV